jgi:hypothetical protein
MTPLAQQIAASRGKSARTGSGSATARSGGGALASPGTSGNAGQTGGQVAGAIPRSVTIAAVVQLIEAIGVLAASLIAGIDAMTGKSYHRSSGIAITVIGVATAVALAYVAYGLRGGRRWSRTPAMLTQLFAGIVGIYLVQAPRLDWGIPAVALAVAGLVALFAPASLKLLTPGRPE